MSSEKKPVLTFDGVEYELDSLSNEAKALIARLKQAEEQMDFYKNTYEMIGVAYSSGIKELAELLPKPEPACSLTPKTEE